MTIRIELPNDSVLNGEKLAGRVEWQSSGKEPRKIEVVCQWRVTGRAKKLTEVVEREVEENIASRTQITVPFNFQIPLSPLSYEGKYFSMVWEVVATADLPLAFDEEDTKTFTVRPRPYDRDEFDRLEGEDYDEEEEEEEEEPSTSS